MNDRKNIAFLAYAFQTGRNNLSAEDQERLSRLASRWVRTGTSVRRRPVGDIPADSGFPGGATVPEFTGTVTAVDAEADTVTISLATPIPVDAGWASADADVVTVPTAWVEPAPAATP